MGLIINVNIHFLYFYKWDTGFDEAPDNTNLDNSDVCANLSRSNGNSNNVGGNTNTQANMKATCTGSYILDVVPGDRIQTKCMATKAYITRVWWHKHCSIFNWFYIY